jgi:hypothetical protein
VGQDDNRVRSVPLRLLDCFRLATPVVSDAFCAFLAADNGGRAVFLMGVEIVGTGSGTFSEYEGEEMMTASAICHDGGLRYVYTPAWRAYTAGVEILGH